MTEANSRIAHGGKALYGARVGILMLETRFPRIPGDMGNAATWPFPVLYRVVKGASPKRVVEDKAAGLRDAFLAAARNWSSRPSAFSQTTRRGDAPGTTL